MTSGTTRAVVLSVVLIVLGLAAVTSEAVLVTALEDEAAVFTSSGASVLTVSAPGQVDGARCESLTRVAGVRAAGALTMTTDRRITVVSLPGAPVPYAAATAGLAKVVHADADGGPGLLVSGDAARLLGATVGQDLQTTDGTTRISGIFEYPSDGRRNGYGYLAIALAPATGAFDECWVDVWPQNQQMRSLLLTTVNQGASAAEEPEVAQLNLTHGLEFDGSVRYRERITRWAGPMVGCLAAVLGFVAVRTRRVELASALHDRVAPVDLWAVVLAETMAWTVPPALLTVAAAAVSFAGHGELGVGLVLGARVAVVLGLGAVVGVAAGLLMTRERDLFLYAKDR
ncbi:MAG: hypothetical protein HGA44_10385 [Cellulomonadaceae bacterium]|nr:hypothetical protein [Cellulomonadaceae bacterium]